MMNQPKLYLQNHKPTLNNACKTDGAGFDFDSILGGDGRILVVGEYDDRGT